MNTPPVMPMGSFLRLTGFLLALVSIGQVPVAYAQIKKTKAAVVREADRLLDLSMTQADSLSYNTALAYAQQAEQQLLSVFSPGDPELFYPYFFIATSAIKSDSNRHLGQEYARRLEGMSTGGNPQYEADRLFLRGVLYHMGGEIDSAFTCYEQAKSRYLGLDKQPHSFLIRLLCNQGTILWNRGKSDQAWLLQSQADSLALVQLGADHPLRTMPLNNLGLALMEMGKFDQSRDALIKNLAIREKTLPRGHLEIAVVQLNLGLVYSYLYDVDAAFIHSQLAAEMFRELKVPMYEAYAINNIGLNLSKQGKWDSALVYYEHNLIIEREIYPPGHQGLLTTASNVANAKVYLGRLDEALIEYREVVRKARPDHKYYNRFVNTLGFIFLQLGQLDSAEKYFQPMLQLALKTQAAYNPAAAEIYINLSEVAIKRGQLEKALELNQLALKAINYQPAGDLQHAFNLIEAAKYLIQRSRILREQHQLNPEEKQLWAWYAACKEGFRVGMYARSQKSGPEGRQQVLNRTLDLLSTSIQVCEEMAAITQNPAYLDSAFQLAEQTKGLLLREAIQRSHAQTFAGIPDSVLNREYALQAAIDSLEALRYQLASDSNSLTNPILQALSTRIAIAQRTLAAHESLVYRDYPGYGRAMDAAAPSIDRRTVQQQLLEPGQSLVAYVVSDSLIHAFVIRPDFYRVFRIRNDFSLSEHVSEMVKQGIAGYYSLPEGQRMESALAASDAHYATAAALLYEKLWAPFASYLGEQVIIIPDGVLNYLPFEALFTQRPERIGRYSTYPYLLEQHEISYCYSATLLHEMQQKQHAVEPRQSILAMAPLPVSSGTYAGAHGPLQGLPASEPEVRQIARLLGGKALVGSGASPDAFRQVAPEYRYLHLGTHAQADEGNGDFAFLAFASPQAADTYDCLYSRNLYQLRLNADLVFLSACETAIGPLKRGEGMISLARAFAYAGAKSIITTLWKVEDKYSSEIAQAVYAHIQSGMSRGVALRKAKRDFIHTHSGQEVHPYFWAGLIGIGDMGK